MTLRYPRVALSLLLVSGAVAVTMLAACGSFDASSTDTPPAPVDPVEASADAEPPVDGAPKPDADVDAGPAPKRCRGAFQPPTTVAVDPAFVKSLRSVRGAANGAYLVSWDTSPDDNMGTATLGGTGLVLDPGANRFSALNAPTDESTPTGPAALGYILFASNRAVPAVTDGGTGPSLLFVSKANDNFGSATNVDVANVTAGASIRNPYLVDTRVFFDVNDVLRAGTFVKATSTVDLVSDVPGVELGTHPVPTSDRLEIFYKVGAGVRMQSRPDTGASFATAPLTILGSMGDYPTWVSDDACKLFVIHQSADGKELLVLDRDL